MEAQRKNMTLAKVAVTNKNSLVALEQTWKWLLRKHPSEAETIIYNALLIWPR